MRKEYEEELEALKKKMEKAERFAERLSVFSDIILERKISGEEEWIKFANKYKQTPLAGGINRGLYSNVGNRYVGNFPKDKEYNLHLFNIYINRYSMFGCDESFGLYEYLSKVEMFFVDTINGTFYLDDDHIGAFLEAVNTWYCDACKKLKKFRREQKIAKLKAELEKEEQYK